MSDKKTVVCPLPDAPKGAKMDKNGYWRDKKGWLLPGQPSLNKGGLSEKRKLFKEACQNYSLSNLGRIADMFWDDDISVKDRIAIQNYLTKYGFGLPAQAPEDRESLERFTDLLPTIVRNARQKEDEDE